jgi:hypothetical protein
MSITLIVLALLALAPVAYSVWMLAYAASPQRILDRRLRALSKHLDL